MKYHANLRRQTLILLSGVAFVALGFTINSLAAELVLKPQSKVWLTGDSTLHPYSSTATVVNLVATFQQPDANPSPSLADLSQSDVLSFTVTIPVEGLKSGEKGLDKNMYKTLKADKFPSIEFRLTDKYLLAKAPAAGANQLTSTGVLSIAGKGNEVQINSQVELLPEGIHISGIKHLLMTDYGVKPPTMMAVIKTRNDVVIHFDLILGAKEGQN